MKITYLGWSAFFLQAADGVTAIIDPYFGEPGIGRPRRIEESYEYMETLSSLDVIAVSHNNPDHLGEALALAKRFGLVLCCGPDTMYFALEQGLPARQIGVVVSGSEFIEKGFRFKALESRHVSLQQLGPGRYLTGQPLGFMITDIVDDVTVYHPGDTSLFGDLALFGKIYRPTLAMLGVGGVVRAGRPIVELSPREAATAAEMLGVKYAVPMHYMPDTDEPRQFEAALAVAAPLCKAITMQVKDTIAWRDSSFQHVD